MLRRLVVVGERVAEPTMLDYLFPGESNLVDAMIPQVHSRWVPGSKTTTAGFAPRYLDRNRLPFLVQYCDHLPEVMKTHLLELLEFEEDYRRVANKPASRAVRAKYDSLIIECNNTHTNALAREADVRDLGGHVAGPVAAMYRELTGRILHAPPDVPTIDSRVRTDRVYRLDNEEGNIVALWEDKKPKVGEYYTDAIPRLLRSGDITFDNDHHTKWDQEKAILGKVCVSIVVAAFC